MEGNRHTVEALRSAERVVGHIEEKKSNYHHQNFDNNT